MSHTACCAPVGVCRAENDCAPLFWMRCTTTDARWSHVRAVCEGNLHATVPSTGNGSGGVGKGMDGCTDVIIAVLAVSGRETAHTRRSSLANGSTHERGGWNPSTVRWQTDDSEPAADIRSETAAVYFPVAIPSLQRSKLTAAAGAGRHMSGQCTDAYHSLVLAHFLPHPCHKHQSTSFLFW